MTAIILAGGKSTRIGTNKAFLKLGEKTLLERILSKLDGLFEETLIIANARERFNSLGVRVLSDIIPSKGPLGGIYTGLVRSASFYNFVVACDMPFLNSDLIKFMLERLKDYDVIVPRSNGRLEPLCAIYSKRCIKPIEKELSNNTLKITDFFQFVNPVRSKSKETTTIPLVWTSNGVKVRVVREEEIAGFDSDVMSFTNINTPEDYIKWNRKR